LLADLFKPRAWGDDAIFFPHDRFPNLADDLFMTRVLFNSGQKEGLWSNAEGFLAYADAAHRAEGSPRRAILASLAKRTKTEGLGETGPPAGQERSAMRERVLANLDRVTRRALAAQTAEFLLDLDQQDERWRPYRDWVSTLQPMHDTVISLNYDLVLEGLGGDRLAIPLPHEAQALPNNRVPVLKLHGSIDWKQGGKTVERVPSESLLTSEETMPAIAAPGRSKTSTVKDNFEPLWKVARRALGAAGAIMLVGYSFPQTDAGARMDLLNSIANGNAGYRTRRIDIVMGPDRTKPDVRRVHALAEACANGRKLTTAQPMVAKSGPSSGDRFLWVTSQPLCAEDFIADYMMRLREFSCDG
jgi:hypothetical protein